METSRQLALYLLQSKAIIIDPANPFKWASGWHSPIYCDNRKTLSFPDIRSYIRDSFKNQITEEYKSPDMIAGVATGAIAHAALVADALSLPMLYVRASRKEHGLGNQIEGEISPGRTVVVIEDLVSTGGSSLKAVAALRKANLEVLGMAAIFTYGFKVAEDSFREAGVNLLTLSNYPDLIQEAARTGYVNKNDLETLNNWRKDPAGWKRN
jgi:orotate phosphoribosyltransferase